MKRTDFEEITKQLWKNDYEYIYPSAIDGIEMGNGLILYLPWQHCKIAKDKKYVYIKYGDIVPCGGRLPLEYDMSFDRMTIRMADITVDTDGNSSFRLPQLGDNIVYFSNGKLYKNSILDVNISSNMSIISVAMPISGDLGGSFAFYDPGKYDKDLYVLYNKQGIFLSFSPKTTDDYDVKIKISDIKKINIK